MRARVLRAGPPPSPPSQEPCQYGRPGRAAHPVPQRRRKALAPEPAGPADGDQKPAGEGPRGARPPGPATGNFAGPPAPIIRMAFRRDNLPSFVMVRTGIRPVVSGPEGGAREPGRARCRPGRTPAAPGVPRGTGRPGVRRHCVSSHMRQFRYTRRGTLPAHRHRRSGRLFEGEIPGRTSLRKPPRSPPRNCLAAPDRPRRL